MKNRFFVMIYTEERVSAITYVDEHGETVFWESYSAALRSMESTANMLVRVWGFEIHKLHDIESYN